MMSFIFNYFVSMRYSLLGYLRPCICLAGRIAFQDPAQLVLLGISEGTRTES
jgi:hypothetical protein